MDRPTYLALVALSLAACGPRERLPSHMPPAKKARVDTSDVQTWEVGPDLAAKKKIVVDTVRSAGGADDLVALILAVSMGETVHMAAAERDTSKDSMPMSRNFSCINMNGDFLQSIGITGAAAEALNDDANLADAVRAFIAGVNKYGAQKMLCFHRGGSEARDNGYSCGAQEYCAAMEQIKNRILSEPSLFTDTRRAGKFIVHV